MKRAIIIGGSPEVRAYTPEIYENADAIIAINYAFKNLPCPPSQDCWDNLQNASYYRVAADDDPQLRAVWESNKHVWLGKTWTDIAPWSAGYTFARYAPPIPPNTLPTYITSLVPAVYFAGQQLGAEEIILVGCPFIKQAGSTRLDGPTAGDTDWEELAEQVGKVLKEMPTVPKTTTPNSPLGLEYFPLHRLVFNHV